MALHRRQRSGALFRVARRGATGVDADADSHALLEAGYPHGTCSGHDNGAPCAEYGQVAGEENLPDRLRCDSAGGLYEEAQDQAPEECARRHDSGDENGDFPQFELRHAQESDDGRG